MSSSATHRPVGLLTRPDIQSCLRETRHGTSWAIQDPLSLRSYQLGEEEYFILRLVDGRRSFSDIKRLFDRQFAPRRILPEQLHAYLGMLHREGLVVALAEGQGQVLSSRRTRSLREQFWRSLSNPLAIRLPGVNPDPLLSKLSPTIHWLLSPAVVAIAICVVISAMALLVIEWTRLANQLIELPAFLQANPLAFALAVAFSKVLHEYGHALTCKRLGRRCHEIGVMFLVFIPCLYCNVSDASMLPNKWKRMAVTAAGVAVEIVLAATCLWVWRLSSPGFVNDLSLAIAIVCSANTLFINGNPLLRFDGYFLLADYVEIPHLAHAARQACSRAWSRLWSGAPTPSARLHRNQTFLVVYGVASFIYRWLVLIVILVALYRFLEPIGLAVLAHFVTLVLLVTTVFVPIFRKTKSTWETPSASQPSRTRRRTAVASALVLLAIATFIPIVDSLRVPIEIAATDAIRVYVTEPGFVTQLSREAQTVEKGQVLARLENLELQRATAILQSHCDQQQLLVQNLLRLQNVIPEADEQLVSAKALLASLQDQLDQRKAAEQQLTLRAPRDGVVLAPSARSEVNVYRQLHSSRANPLDQHNQGAHLSTGTWYCSIGDPNQIEAVALIEQAQVQRVQVGQRVRCRLNMLPGRPIDGRILELSKANAETDTVEATSSTNTDTLSGRTPYRARIAFDDDANILSRIGSRGTAKITIEAESIAMRCYRYLRRTFSRGT